MKRARKAFSKFHGREAVESVRAHVPNPPKQAFALGEVVAIVYKRPGEPVPYEHKFRRRRPLLVSDVRGNHLFFVGGDFKVTSRGIVG